MKEGDTTLFNYQLNEKILLKNNEQGLAEGDIEAGTFTNEVVEMEDGKSYSLVVQVELEGEEGIIKKDIEYELLIKGYKSFVMPV